MINWHHNKIQLPFGYLTKSINSCEITLISEKKSVKNYFKMSYQQEQHQQQANPNDQQQTPWHISEANSDCLHFFGKLKVQREQCRFTDLILIVQGREFSAHRCILAACSPWFDARLKVHKNTRECLKIDQCKDYKIFYALLEYCYTGFILLDKHNVSELLNLSVFFQMDKLKSYCCKYLNKNLDYMNIPTAVELAFQHSLNNLIRRSFTYLQHSFEYFYANDRDALMQYSPQLVEGTISYYIYVFFVVINLPMANN